MAPVSLASSQHTVPDNREHSLRPLPPPSVLPLLSSLPALSFLTLGNGQNVEEIRMFGWD